MERAPPSRNFGDTHACMVRRLQNDLSNYAIVVKPETTMLRSRYGPTGVLQCYALRRLKTKEQEKKTRMVVTFFTRARVGPNRLSCTSNDKYRTNYKTRLRYDGIIEEGNDDRSQMKGLEIRSRTR